MMNNKQDSPSGVPEITKNFHHGRSHHEIVASIVQVLPMSLSS